MRIKEIYRGNTAPKDTDLMWIRGKEILLFSNGGWVNVNESTIVDTELDPTSNHPIANSAVAASLSNAEESLSETSENLIKNRAVYKQYMDSDDEIDVLAILDSYYWRKKPLTMKILTDGNITWKRSSNQANLAKEIEYRKNGGTWTSITATFAGVNIAVVAGDILQFRGNNTAYGVSYDTSARFTSTATFDLEGNICSLINATDFINNNVFSSGDVFPYLFSQAKPVNAKNLVLPTNVVTNECYYGMFKNCTTLVSGPEILAQLCGQKAFKEMFYGCTSLTAAPTISLLDINVSCCESMFEGCTSLVKGPTIPIVMFNSSTANGCWNNMFKGCSSLNEITILLSTTSNITPSSCMYNMFYGVANTGTLHKNPNLTSWPSADTALPNGWTITDVEL